MDSSTQSSKVGVISNKSVKQEISDKVPKSLQKVVIYFENKLSKKAILRIVRFALWCMYGKIDVYGKIPEEASLICPKHVHFLDSVVIKTILEGNPEAFESTMREIMMMSKKEHNEEPLLKPLFDKHFPTHFIDRENPGIDWARNAGKSLKEGKHVAIYVEGTRNGYEKGLPPQPGAAFLAKVNKVKVVPINFDGKFKNQRTLMQKLLLQKRNKLKVLIGDPLDVSGMRKEEATEYIMDSILALKTPESDMQKTLKKENI